MQLDKTSKRVLKFIKENPEISVDELNKEFGDSISNSIETLLDEKLIYQPIKSAVGSGVFAPAPYFSISAKGKTYYQYRKRNAFLKIAPLIISVISLLLSAYSIFVSSYKCP